ncbi:hypothetical protein RN001_011130 [Aquatica leii]|uniref:Peptidase S1 domain-containing protein n=1 Tax=Aquatica leii TaxID=1421715 RepID=A0AAN7SGI1_9COLE|nr:hypothetical protein RN001_011130 [Aquatica leii]
MCLIKSICFFVPIAALCCGFTFAVDKRIVNGVLATIEKYPYMVSLRTTKNIHFCGGSIVNRYCVLTSARCLSLVPTFVIVTGTNDLNSGGATYSVAKILKHPSFDTNTMNYDAGIAKVTVPIVLSATVAPVVLSSIVPSVGTNVVVTGWGYKIYPGGAISPLLQAVNTTLTRRYERARYGGRRRDSSTKWGRKRSKLPIAAIIAERRTEPQTGTEQQNIPQTQMPRWDPAYDRGTTRATWNSEPIVETARRKEVPTDIGQAQGEQESQTNGEALVTIASSDDEHRSTEEGSVHGNENKKRKAKQSPRYAARFEHRFTTNLQNCVKQTMEKVFNYDDTILFVNFESEDIFPGTISNPYVILNYSVNEDIIYTDKVISNKINTVLHLKNYTNKQLFTLGTLQPVRPHHRSIPPTKTTIFITYISAVNNLTDIFLLLWINNIINVAVIVYDPNNNFKVYYANPNAPANECATKFKDFVATDCNSTFTYEFPKIMRKYPSCTLGLLTTEDMAPYVSRSKIITLTVYTVKAVSELLNISLKQRFMFDANLTETFYLMINSPISTVTGTSTVSFFQDQMIWVVPVPKKISVWTVLTIVFKPIVWALVVSALLITSTIWWLMLKVYPSNENFNNFIDVFFDVYAITVLGSTNRPPTAFTLRLIFLMYVVYSIHIQTAFTSNLVTLLTVPQYTNQIKNVEDIASSDIPIFIIDNVSFATIKRKDIYKSVSTRIEHPSENAVRNMIRQSNNYNYSVFLLGDLFYLYKQGAESDINYFLDDSDSGTIQFALWLPNFSYFWYSLNEIIVRLIESGRISRIENLFRDGRKHYYHRLSEIDAAIYERVVITLNHLCSIFAIWGIGLILAVFVFIGEHLTFYVKQRKLIRLKSRNVHVSNL